MFRNEKKAALSNTEQHLLIQLMRLEVTQQCSQIHIVVLHLFSFLFFLFRSLWQRADQQMRDGVLKVKSHYSGEDTSKNIWTVSGLAVCRQLCLHLLPVKISL